MKLFNKVCSLIFIVTISLSLVYSLLIFQVSAYTGDTYVEEIIRVSENAGIRPERPTATYLNSYPNMWVWGDRAYGLFKFGLGNIDSTDSIESAKISLFLIQLTLNNGPDIILHDTNPNWSSSTLNWENRPQPFFIKKSFARGSTNKEGQWYEFDITDYIKDKIDNENKTLSIAVGTSTADNTPGNMYVGIDSMNNTSGNAPFIKIVLKSDPRRYYSRELQKRIKNSVVLYEGSPNAFVNNARKIVDQNNVLVKPVIYEGRTLVPVRFIAESFGANVGWDSTTGITVQLADKIVKMKLDNDKININGVEENLDVPAKLINGRTFIPLRALVEALGKKVFWDDRGLIVISDNAGVFDKTKDLALINELLLSEKGVMQNITKPDIKVDIIAEPPVNEQIQIEKFNNRDSSENVEKLAKKFFSTVKLDKPELAEIKKLVEIQSYSDALKVYRAHFINKLKNIDLHSMLNYNEPFLIYTAPQRGVSTAEELLYGIKTIGEKKVVIGNPGKVNWSYGLNYYNDGMSQVDMINLISYDSLLMKTGTTSNLRYLEKWCEYIDDLSLNIENVPMADAVDTGYNNRFQIYFPQSIRAFYDLTHIFDAIAPDGGGLSETTLARLIMMIVDNYMPQGIVTARCHPQNWLTDIPLDLIMLSFILEDFYAGDFYFNEGLSLLESYDTEQNYLDGTELQRSFNYNVMWFRQVHAVYDVIKKYRPNQLTQEREKWFEDNIFSRANYFVRILSPNGNWPIIGRTWAGNLSLNDYWGYNDTLLKLCPEAYEDPVTSSILSVTMDDKRKTPLAIPNITSDSLPYGGYYMIREGWDKDSQYGSMFASDNAPVATKIKDFNAFGIGAFGQDLLVNLARHFYSEDPAPLSVDGHQPSILSTLTRLGHKSFNKVVDKPNKFRNHNSTSFDLIEGIYSGSYGEFSLYLPQLPELYYPFLEKMFSGVSHNRQVEFLRDIGLWIITDKVSSYNNHQYKLDWYLPAEALAPSPTETYKVFTPEQVFVDDNNKHVKTQAPNQANISLYNFGTAPLTYDKEFIDVAKGQHGSRFSSFYRVGVNFSGEGDHTVVTIAYPRKSQNDEIKSIEEVVDENNTSTGFKVELNDGSIVKYIAASDKQKNLALDEYAITGESLLILKKATGEVKGIALGCSKIALNGLPQSTGGNANFEFKVVDGKIQDIIAIYTPINQVSISPQAKVFSEPFQVTMTCETDDVNIIYTTDGSEPIIGSSNTYNYVEPITVSDTSMVKARAIRKGLTKMPETMSSTHASVVSYIAYEKKTKKEAVNTSGMQLQNGLRYEYYDGYWRSLFNVANRVGDFELPKKSGTVSKLFDITQRQTDKPFAFIYNGYINIPKDGDYTFYEPHEYYTLSMDAGYELQLYVDGEKWSPGRRKDGTGLWTVALSKGMHLFEVRYLDYRSDVALVKFATSFPKLATIRFDRTGEISAEQRRNFPEYPKVKNFVWDGVAPNLMISGPGIDKITIPDTMFYYQSN